MMAENVVDGEQEGKKGQPASQPASQQVKRGRFKKVLVRLSQNRARACVRE